MAPNTQRQPTAQPDGLSRRRFIGVAAAAGAGFCGGARAQDQSDRPDRLEFDPTSPPSRVVQVRTSHVVKGPAVHATLLREMLDSAVTSLTGTASVDAAWRSILAPDDIVGVKFNRCGQETIATTEAVATALRESLRQAGWQPDRIVYIEAPPGLAARHGTQPARPGYSTAIVSFGSGADRFAAVLDQITALINVPFLKTHNIAGMTCCVKNLSHGLTKHPARYHGNHCAPFAGDIVAASPIRSKLRLNLVDALRVVFDGGPDAWSAGTGDEGAILASVDPVAADTVALQVLNDARARRRLAKVAESAEDIAHLAAAHRRGLGIAVPRGIELVRPGV